jgi:hypothetical protein
MLKTTSKKKTLLWRKIILFRSLKHTTVFKEANENIQLGTLLFFQNRCRWGAGVTKTDTKNLLGIMVIFSQTGL